MATGSYKGVRSVNLIVLGKPARFGPDVQSSCLPCERKSAEMASHEQVWRFVGGNSFGFGARTNASAGWSHPIHIHLINLQVVPRVGSGRKGVES